MRVGLCLLVALGVGLPGCRACESAPGSRGDAAGVADAPSSARCTPRTGEHLGIPFVKVCPQDLAAAGATFEPFWISAHQLGCSAGEHDSLACPSVTSLQHPAAGEARTPGMAANTLAAVVEPSLAQSVCYMRFAGRIPTRQERALAEETMGLASVMVAESAGSPRNFSFLRLAEWVTETPCQTPNASKCSAATFPSGPREPIAWSTLASCEGTPLSADAGVPLLAIGEVCPAPDFSWDAGAGRLPCAVRSPAAKPSIIGFALSCRPPEPLARHPEDDIGKVAAFRCVLPESATLGGR
ncbi:MAG: hypothetical protein IPI67_37865 [Myxococcales bacterium]|nr:hypothetical protein [Myxococcales bacterium]